MPPEVFVDTSAWYPLADASDPHHPAIAEWVRRHVQVGGRFVTTNLVIAETHALLLRRVHRAAALAFLKEVGRPPNVVQWSTSELDARAQDDWLGRFNDQDFTLTDAVSFAVMTERGIVQALALDHHFAVAGFTLVPTESPRS